MMFATINILATLGVLAVVLDIVRRMSWRKHPLWLGVHLVLAWAEFSGLAHAAILRAVPAWVAIVNLMLLVIACSAYIRIERAGGFCVR